VPELYGLLVTNEHFSRPKLYVPRKRQACYEVELYPRAPERNVEILHDQLAKKNIGTASQCRFKLFYMQSAVAKMNWNRH